MSRRPSPPFGKTVYISVRDRRYRDWWHRWMLVRWPTERQIRDALKEMKQGLGSDGYTAATAAGGGHSTGGAQ